MKGGATKAMTMDAGPRLRATAYEAAFNVIEGHSKKMPKAGGDVNPKSSLQDASGDPYPRASSTVEALFRPVGHVGVESTSGRYPGSIP